MQLADATGRLSVARTARSPRLARPRAPSTRPRRRRSAAGVYGGHQVRLLTTARQGAVVEDDGEGAPGSGPLFVQAGFNLTLQTRAGAPAPARHRRRGPLGIGGAVVITLVITDRALAPIREAFATERRFVAAASHELQTPVAVIRASAEILDREHLVDAEGRPSSRTSSARPTAWAASSGTSWRWPPPRPARSRSTCAGSRSEPGSPRSGGARSWRRRRAGPALDYEPRADETVVLADARPARSDASSSWSTTPSSTRPRTGA